MSEYTDYNAASLSYDKLRYPIAVEQILHQIDALTGKPKLDLNILDAGCGTGNYSQALLESGIGKMSLFDASEGMLQVAKDKLDKFQQEDRIGEIKLGVLPVIPFGDGLFDVVMINMVLHHLRAADEDARTNIISSVIRESSRVLKPGGIILITTCFPEQYHGFWYVKLAPEVTSRAAGRFRSRECMSKLLSENGFLKPEFRIIYGSDWAKHYYEAEGPLNTEWRNIDSYWSLLTDQELQSALRRVEEMKAEGTLEKFMHDNDRSNSDGNIVLVTAVKP